MIIEGALRDELKARYAEPHRHYHTWDHVGALCRHFASVRNSFSRWSPVIAAIFFHDAIYDPMRSDNEELSAQLLEHHAQDLMSADDLAFAAAIIRATAKHEVPAGLNAEDEHDLALFLDIDLAILGAPDAVFDQYEADIRWEYAFMPAEAFRAGRRGVLESFASRDTIYFTAEGQEHWEAQARLNLARSLAALKD